MLIAASRAFFCAVLLCLLVVAPVKFASSQEPQSAPEQENADRRSKELASLLDEEWQYELRTSPEFATSIGDPRYNDRFSDNSPAFFRSDVEQKRKFLARFEAIDASLLSEQDKLSRELMIHQLRLDIEGA